MKLATFTQGRGEHIGALTADGAHLVDLAAAASGWDDGLFASMQALIDGEERALDLARETLLAAGGSGSHVVALDAVTLRAPLPVPQQIRDFSVFPTHIRQSRQGMARLARDLLGLDLPIAKDGPAPQQGPPAYYLTNRFSVVGPDEIVRWPRYSTYMDFELEVAAIIGRTGKDIPVERAGEHIFGYTIYNDFSARDTQLVEMAGMLGPSKGKSFDMGNAMGPFIVTRDEIPDVRALRATARINGVTWVDEDLSAMLMGFEEMIAFISRDETIHAGEVLGSGTVGNGCGLEHYRFLSDGDLVELEVAGIGVLRNRIVRQEG